MDAPLHEKSICPNLSRLLVVFVDRAVHAGVGHHERSRTLQLLVNIDVDDVERAVEFYANALGLRLERWLFDGSVAEMHGASSKIYLMAKPAGTAPYEWASSVRDYRRHWTPVHLDFEVDDVTAAVERAVSAGARLEGEIQCFGWGRQATLSDPFGHGFCVLQFSGRGYEPFC